MNTHIDEFVNRLLGCPYHPDAGLMEELRAETGSACHWQCRACGRSFAKEGDIAIFMPDNFVSDRSEESTLKRVEQKVRDNQVSTYLGWFSEYTTAIEFVHIRKTMPDVRNDVLVDLGCGIGRYTLPLAGEAKLVIAVDFSLRSLIRLMAQAKEEGVSNILAVQADITRLPLKSAISGCSVSSQVFTCLPGQNARNSARSEALRILKPDGRFVLTVFNNSIFRRFKRRTGMSGVFEKEGRHPELGFYYFNFGPLDFRRFLKDSPVRNVSRFGVCNMPREFSARWGLEGWRRFAFALDRLVSATWLSNLTGDLLLGSCVKARENQPSGRRIHSIIMDSVTDLGKLTELEQDYDRLVDQSRGKTLYATYEYASSWLQTLGRGRPFRLLLGRENGRLIGICPLVRRDATGIHRKLRLSFSELIGSGLWGYSDLVCQENLRGDFFSIIIDELLTGRQGDFVELGPFIASSTAIATYEEELRKRGVPFERVVIDSAPYIDTTIGLEAFEKMLAGRKAVTSDLNRCRRRLEEQGALKFIRLPDGSSREKIDNHLGMFLDMYHRQWPQNRFLANPTFKELYLEFACRASKKGFLDFTFLFLGDRPIAAHYGFRHDRCLYYFTPTFDIDLQKFSPGKILLRHLIERSFAEGLEFDFQNGVEPYKLEWTQMARERVMLRVQCTMKARLFSRARTILSGCAASVFSR